jgi:predicted  nucleic acid-binding Zn-ribbon protein
MKSKLICVKCGNEITKETLVNGNECRNCGCNKFKFVEVKDERISGL